MVQDLAASRLFQALDDDALERLAAQCTIRPLEVGEALITQGTEVHELAVVRSGLLVVRRAFTGATREVARLGPGGYVGEMALLVDGPASATVVAAAPTEVVVVPHEALSDPLSHPEVRDLVERTVRRRRATNRLEQVDEVEVVTRKGERLLVRPLWPDDWRLMDASRDRVSEESLRRRFFTLPKLHEGFLRRLTQVDFLDQFAWAVIDPSDDALVAVGRSARLPEDPTAAEIALLVADDLQHHGLGHLLVVALASSAAQQDITDFVATALADNHHVRHLLEAHGATWGPGERGQEVTARWPVAAVLERARPELPVGQLRAAARKVLRGD